MDTLKNTRYRLVCKTCGASLQDNESYDFRVNMYKTEGHDIWVFIDNNVDLSGMQCECPNPESEDWDAIEVQG